MASSDEEEDDEREPTLKYSKLTSSLASVYRGGDSSSAFQVSADKLLIGTHNGNVHVFSLPHLHILRSYRGHSSSITTISVSPSSQQLRLGAADGSNRATPPSQPPNREANVKSQASPKSPYRPLPPATPSNSIYIATASIDGHVCVSSLVDDKDVTLRNYSRPVHAVALSPAFRSDRTYLSGGTAGSLILTVGGKVGASSEANTNSATAAAAGWLGSIGLGSTTGRDSVLHSGEGSISTISWSNSGRYVAWNNEFGTRIMHSHLAGADSEMAWKRIGHVPRPNRQMWEEMAGVWKAQTQWVNTKYVESDEPGPTTANEGTRDGTQSPAGTPNRNGGPNPMRKWVERLLVGWGDTVWVIHVNSAHPNPNRPIPAAKAERVHQLRFDDCIVSGLTLYTPSKLAALVFRTTDDDENPIDVSVKGTQKRGRHNSLPPDLRLIDLASQDELETASIVVSRFEQLSFLDYHLSTLWVPPALAPTTVQRNTFEVLGGGLRDMTAGMTTGATRLFSSSASALSGSSGDQASMSTGPTALSRPKLRDVARDTPSGLSTSGLKIVIQSPFDCITAVKRDLPDRLSWLLEREDYEGAWNLVNDHPELIASSQAANGSRPSTVSGNGGSLVDFFDDETSSQSTIGANRNQTLAVKHEQQRIGDLWMAKLVQSNDWAAAGQVAGKTLGDSPRWEAWIMDFARQKKFDDIAPFIPTDQIHPPLPSHVYEIVLGHYISHDRLRLQELLDRWHSNLFDVSSVSRHIESFLETGEVRQDTIEDGVKGKDWRILLDCLARLYLADARPTDAISCYIRTKNADSAIEVIRDYAKIDAIADKIYAFMTLRISTPQLHRANIQELDNHSSEPISLLAEASVQGTIDPSRIITQLKAKAPASNPFLFFYFRRLWKPAGTNESDARTLPGNLVSRSRFTPVDAAETPGRAILAPYADLVVTMFAEFSRILLDEYLRITNDYTFEHASDECRKRHYIPELVHLLCATGQTKMALHLIIDELDDVPMAIAFAKEVDDEGLWGDLLDYGMDKPTFIRGLLEDVGTSINPVTLVRRIPLGLPVDGLKSSLGKLLRESEITWSISKGASKVLEGEISSVSDELRRRREHGTVFNVEVANPTSSPSDQKCNVCGIDVHAKGQVSDTQEYLIGFFCQHIFHLACLLDEIEDETNRESVEKLRRDLADEEFGLRTSEHRRVRVGSKMQHARMIKDVLGSTSCLTCHTRDGG